MDFGNVRLGLDASAIGVDRSRRIAQVFANQSEGEPGAAVARSKSHGSFELDARRLQFTRLSQARSKRRSRFGKVGRRLERSSKSHAGLTRAIERQQRRAQPRVVHRIRGRFSCAGEGKEGRFRVACLVERLADLAPTLDKVRKTDEQVLENGPRFLIARTR